MAANADTRVNRTPFISIAKSRAADRALARWGIVLAGGEGARMRPLISDWLGEDRPKQYCTFVGSRSMFQHTIDRARSVVPEEHVVTIIGPGHRKFLAETEREHVPGLVLEQPSNLGTAPGVFLPMAYVLADDPEATVVLLPSDHFVHPEQRFCDYIMHAFDLAEKYRDQLVLAAAIPDRAETDYGWIAPGKQQTEGPSPLTPGPISVMCFQEKPAGREALALLRQGCLWNTMVVAARAKTLWALGRRHLPEMMYAFDAFLTVLRAVREGRVDPKFEASALESVYSDLAPADFSKDILQHVSSQSMLLPMDGVDWCDWGRPQRVTETLARLGRRPFFVPDGLENGLESATLANESQKWWDLMKKVDREQTFEQILLSHVEMCYGVACNLTRNSADASDLTRKVLIEAWHRREKADAMMDIKGKLLTAVRKRFQQDYCPVPRHLERNSLCGEGMPWIAQGV
jgi:mannose-1-phosphate guanylyltransferase